MGADTRAATLGLLLAVAWVGPGYGQEPCRPPIFAEAAADAGVTFVHETGATGNKHNPETMGAGVAWLDYDGDGWQDLYVIQSGPFPPRSGEGSPNRLFRNLGGNRFEEVTAASSTGELGYGQGVVAADVDGDADADLYLSNYGPDRLLENLGNGRFAEATSAAGLGLDGWSSSAALADADGDGDLDLYVTRYVEHDPEDEPFCAHPKTGERWYCDPSVFVGRGDAYFRNLGGGRFEDATAEAGFGSATGKGLGVVFVDLDGDLAPDVYVANDMTINLLFVNDGGGGFEDLSLLSGTSVSREGAAEAGMGLGVGDLDEDGDADLTVTNYDVQTNTLYINRGDFQFEDVSAASGFGLPSFNLVGFGIAMADFNRDGHLDAYIGNGHTTLDPVRENVDYAQPDLLLLGDGAGRFRSTCAVSGGAATVTRGLAVADYDNDGDPDLAAQRSGGPLSLLRNESDGASPWLGLRLAGRDANSEGVGAVVRLGGPAGSQTRWVMAGESYQSSSDRRVLLALPTGGPADSLAIDWPSGKRQRFARPPAGSYLTVNEPSE